MASGFEKFRVEGLAVVGFDFVCSRWRLRRGRVQG